MLNQGHLKEQSVHRRQMETISSLLENSQSSKGHVCFYFPRHRLGENCSRATWCAYGKHQLAWGTPKILLWMDLWPPQVTLILGDAPYFDLLLHQLLCQTFLQIYGEASNMACHKAVSHSLCKVPCCFIWIPRHCSPALFLYCCTVPFHLHSNL